MTFNNMRLMTLRFSGILLNKCFLFLPLLFSFSPAFSTCLFNGKIFSSENRLPLEGARIALSGGNQIYTAVSSADGGFSVEIYQEGEFKINVSHVSYAEYNDTLDIKCTGAASSVTIYLIENNYQLLEVTVNAGLDDDEKALKLNEFSSVSYHLLSPERLQILPAVVGDPGRLAATLPGVMGTGQDDDNEVVVRGNTPRSNSWRVENIDVPTSMSHFSEGGTSGGNISMISPQLMGTSEFFTSAYPANYGNGYGGIFDIRLRSGSKENYRLKFKASIIGMEIGHEGNIAHKYTYNFNYRYSTLGLVQKMGIDLKGLDTPQYQDFNFKMAYPLKKGREVSVFGINGQNSMRSESTVESLTGEDVLSRTTDDNEVVALNGISFTRSFNSKKKLGVYAAYFHNNYQSDFTERSRTDFLEPGYERYHNNFLIGHLNYKTNIRESLSFNAGVLFNQWFYDLEMYDYSSYIDTSDWVLDAHGNTQLYQAYATFKKQVRPSFNMIFGVHTLYFNLNKKYSVEPRIYLNWQPSKKHKLSYGFGMHSKTENLIFYLTKNARNYLTPADLKNLDLTRSVHNVVSYRFVPNEGFNVSVEVYYQYLYRLAVSGDSIDTYYSSVNNSGPSDLSNLNNRGHAYNYGIDVAFSFTTKTRWLVLFNSSLFDSKYVDAQNVKRSTVWNTNFALNATVGKECIIGKNKMGKLRVGATGILTGGRRYVPIDLEKSIVVQDDVFDGTNAYEPRGAPYYRIDAQLAYILKRPKFEWEIKLDIQNLTHRENEVEQDYVPNYGIAKDMRGQIIPILSTSFDFLWSKKR